MRVPQLAHFTLCLVGVLYFLAGFVTLIHQVIGVLALDLFQVAAVSILMFTGCAFLLVSWMIMRLEQGVP